MRICPQCNTPYPDGASKCMRDNTALVTLNDAKKTSPEPSAADSLIGTLIGNYRLQKLLGAGGMGSVYLATHISVDKEVAIKIIKEGENQNQNLIERFFREARAIAKIKHENVIELLDFGTTPEGLFYLVVELLIGKDLADLLNEQPILPIDRAIHISTQIANGLEVAHQQKIVHRDLKPENIFLTSFREDSDFVKILDFGIAKDLDDIAPGERGMTDPGKFLGTPLYMAPEQGAEVDYRSDVYALGLILFRMVTGQLAFRSGNLADLIYKHLTQPPPAPRSLNPAIPEALERVILKALSKAKAERFSSMKEFAQALKAVSTEGVAAAPVLAVSAQEKLPRTVTTLSGSSGEAAVTVPKARPLVWFGVAAALVVTGAVTVLLSPKISEKSDAVQAPFVKVPIVEEPKAATQPTSITQTQPAAPATAPAAVEPKTEPKKVKAKKIKSSDFSNKPNTGL